MGYSGDGGPAVKAELDRPEGMAFAADGTLYFADEGNGRVRAISPSGNITTVVGSGNSSTSGFVSDGTRALEADVQPNDVAIDPRRAPLHLHRRTGASPQCRRNPERRRGYQWPFSRHRRRRRTGEFDLRRRPQTVSPLTQLATCTSLGSTPRPSLSSNPRACSQNPTARRAFIRVETPG